MKKLLTLVVPILLLLTVACKSEAVEEAPVVEAPVVEEVVIEAPVVKEAVIEVE